VLGDARLSLGRSKPRHDFLVLDAFSSDAIPLHLISREAVQMYFEHLSDDGVVAFHISNRHLDLRPVLGAIASDLGLSAISRFDRVSEKTPSRQASEWLLMARSPECFGGLKSDARWVVPERAPRVWTDAFSDILSALR
jgi:spermidine synthase